MVFLPLIRNYTRFGLGDSRYWGVLLILTIFFFSPRTFSNKHLLYVIVYLIYFFLFTHTFWYNIDYWNLGFVREEILNIIAPIVLLTYFYQMKDYSSYVSLVKWALIFIFITTLLTIYTTTIDPRYVRMVTAGAYSSAQLEKIRAYGGGGYSFVSILLFLLPILVYFIRESKTIQMRIVLIFFSILSYAAILLSQIFANLIIATLVLILSIGGTKHIKRSFIYVSIIFLIIILIPPIYLSDLFGWIATFFSTDSVTYAKLIDLSSYLQFDRYSAETQVEFRFERYPMLFEAFMNSPLVGQYNYGETKKIIEGGHLYWMNRLAVYGIINFIFFISIFYIFIKKTLKMIDREYTFYYLLSLFAGLGYGFIKNIIGQDFHFMLFFILPGFYYMAKRFGKQDNASFIMQKQNYFINDSNVS